MVISVPPEPVASLGGKEVAAKKIATYGDAPWGKVFDSSIEVPVTIRNPDRPIGTHVFAAMARNEAGLKKALATIPKLRDEFWQNVAIPGDANNLNKNLTQRLR